MRSLRLMGEEVIPAVREMGKELELYSPFEVDARTNQPIVKGIRDGHHHRRLTVEFADIWRRGTPRG